MSDKNTREALLAYLRGSGIITAAEAAKVLNLSISPTRRVPSRLVGKGAVAASGANRNRKYKAVR